MSAPTYPTLAKYREMLARDPLGAGIYRCANAHAIERESRLECEALAQADAAKSAAETKAIAEVAPVTSQIDAIAAHDPTRAVLMRQAHAMTIADEARALAARGRTGGNSSGSASAAP